MKPIEISALDPKQLAALDDLYRSTRTVRLRTRAQMVLPDGPSGRRAAPDRSGDCRNRPRQRGEFNLSWMPILKAMWGPKGQQVMIPTPSQPTKRHGIGAVNYHSGETVVLIRCCKRRPERTANSSRTSRY